MKSAVVSRFSLVAMMVLCLATTIVGVALVPKSAGAQPHNAIQIESPQWLDAKYEGVDSFYGQAVVAYQTGGSARLSAVVWNGFDNDATVNYARLQFGWGGEAISATAGSPTKISKNSYALFEWQSAVPTTASSLIVHTWEIKVKCTVEADTPFDREDSTSGFNFVVYTGDQADCRDQIDIWQANNAAYNIWGYKGREMMTEAVLSYNKAEDQYGSGNFDDAKASYTDAVTKQDEAIKADAKCALTDQSAQALQGTGGNKGIGYLIAGIGILLAGIGVMVGVPLWVMRGKKPA